MKNKLLFNNTYKSGSVTYIVFKDGNKYTGVCLEFDLVVQGDTLNETKEILQDYSQLWHKNAVKNKLPETVLNRPAPPKYWEIYKLILNEEEKKIKLKNEVTNAINKPFVVSSLPYTSQFPTMAYC
jgi:hypothetical protein